MELFQALTLGLIQGITEFLPISSSGHLVLVPSIFGWELQDVSFDLGLHAGTSVAVLIYFFNDWRRMSESLAQDILSWLKNVKSPLHNILRPLSLQLLYILIATLPVGIIGILFEKVAEDFFRAPLSVAIMLIGFSFVMLSADLFALRNTKSTVPTFKKIIIIALSQVVALIPGVSRSGITISTGMFLGLTRDQAASFSFLLATPIILAATIFKLPDMLSGNTSDLGSLFVGFIFSFVSGFICIKWLIKFLKNNSLKWFIFYRILLGTFIIWFFYFK